MRSYVANIGALPRDIRLFLAYNLLANIGFGVFQLIFNLYLVELNLREDYIGALSAVQTVCMAIAGLTLGRVLGRFGTWRSMLGGVGMLFVVSYAMAFTENAIALIMMAGLFGVGLCYLFNITMPFIIEFAPHTQRALVASLSFSLISASVTIGSLVGGFAPRIMQSLLADGGEAGLVAYRWTLVIGMTVAVAGFVPLLRMREARRSTRAQELARAPIVETPREQRQVKRDMLVFVAAGGLMSLGAGMVIPFYNVFLTSLGADSREVGYVFAIGSGAAAITGLTSPWFANRFGPIRAVALLRMAMMPFYTLLIFVPGYGLAILAHAIRQITINVAWPVDSTFIGDILPPRARSTVFGWRSGAWNIGSALAAIVAGWTIVRYGYAPTFVSLMVFTTAATVLFVAYYGRHPRVRDGRVITEVVEVTSHTTP